MEHGIRYMMVTLGANELQPASHCRHDDGSWSVRLTAGLSLESVYIDGTPDELSDLVDRFAQAVAGVQADASLRSGVEAAS